jgi:hypothetical protein
MDVVMRFITGWQLITNKSTATTTMVLAQIRKTPRKPAVMGTDDLGEFWGGNSSNYSTDSVSGAGMGNLARQNTTGRLNDLSGPSIGHMIHTLFPISSPITMKYETIVVSV